jgi:hypothetical protein
MTMYGEKPFKTIERRAHTHTTKYRIILLLLPALDRVAFVKKN